MHKLFLFLLMFLSTPVISAVGDKVNSTTLVINEIRVQNYQGDAYYYFTPQGGDWMTAGCPGTLHAFIKESDAGAKAILSIALTSKTTQTPVKFTGTCGDLNGNAGYMMITNIKM